MSSSSLSLRSLFPSTTQIWQSDGGTGEHTSQEHDINDHHHRRFYGNIDMQLNSTRLLLSPDHIATQIREPSCSAETEDTDLSARSIAEASPRTPTPPPADLPPPRILRRRADTVSIPFQPTDTRRHGVILDEPLGPSLDEDLPSYAPLPSIPFRRVTDSGTLSAPIDARTLRSRSARQRELRELQRQWTVRRRTHPTAPSELPRTERTRYRARVSEAFDLPPPYASADPYPLYTAEPRRPSLVARILLFPFVPEVRLLERAAKRTDQWAALVKGNVKTGVREVGRKAKAVPRRFEEKRAERKIRWLEERGRVDVFREREDLSGEPLGEGGARCSRFASAYHINAMVA